MTNFSTGDLVVSLYGHDRGGYFIVLSYDGEYVTICDGKRRKAARNKKKKNKHVKATGLSTDLINNAEMHAIDAIVRREIARLTKQI